jgi:hypothetical protein
MNDPQDLGNHEQLQEEYRRNCYDGGYEDGTNSNSFNEDKDNGCDGYGNSYEDGFKVGCHSVEGNTYDSCQLIIQGHDNPDDPAFCKTIGDICDPDGFVKPGDAYCRSD